ncbi:hypothetical protein GGX14DRAFT_560749 [Mycena pura]|uniref:Uncharacterized protein n=1 Tax=Mycena pura TaxID=153505 RepID=A0AAD6VPK4_9AGAR|nr:hypothetical protein GGX14DRAFT_560749 [Mycena pura]
MAIALTFTSKKILESALVSPEGAVHYTTQTTHGLLALEPKATTITAASGVVGVINWHDKVFVLNGVQRAWGDLKSKPGGLFSSEREWNWGDRPYTLKYHGHPHKELRATPNFNGAGTVRFTPYQAHLLHTNEPAVIHLPSKMQDETERMFLLMVILQTETRRQKSHRDLCPIKA